MLGSVLGGAGEPFRGGGAQADAVLPYFRFISAFFHFPSCVRPEIMISCNCLALLGLVETGVRAVIALHNIT